MKNKLFRKGLAIGFIFLFWFSILAPVSFGLSIRKENIIVSNTSFNEGSLLGYVNDSLGNPIEGALVRVYFHETYEENYSDSNGYYYVDNIPICYCYKNATCFKDGYKTEWILLCIHERTTHDFVLIYNGNNPPDEPIINGPPTGKPGVEYTFCITLSDSDGDDLFVKWDWGDGTNTEWCGPFESGMEICATHIWDKTGIYIITVTIRDEYGATITASFKFIIPRNKIVINSNWSRFTDVFLTLEILLNSFGY